MTKQHGLIAVMAALTLALAACGRETSPPPSTPPAAPSSGLDESRPHNAKAEATTTAPLTTADLDKIGKAAKPYKIVLIVKTRNNPFFEPMIKAFEAEAERVGAWHDVGAPARDRQGAAV